jgi:hypothetical protein
MKNAKEMILAYLQDIAPNLSKLAKTLKIPKFALAHWVRTPEKYNIRREHLPKLLHWCLSKGIKFQDYQGDYIYHIDFSNVAGNHLGQSLKIICLNNNTHEYSAATLWLTGKDNEGEQIFTYKNLCEYENKE